MKKAAFFLTAFVLFSIEARFTFFGIRPCLTILLACFAGFKGGPRSGLLAGAFLGLLEDGFSGGILGPGMLGKGMAGYISGYLAGPLSWKPAYGYFGIFFLTAFDGAVSFTSRAALDQTAATTSNAAFVVTAQSLLNSLSAPVLRPREKR